MNPNIIFSGRSPDIVNALASGAGAAETANQVQDQNALRSLYQEQGPQIAAGEGNALNALARLNPEASMGVRQSKMNQTLTGERINQVRDEVRIGAMKAVQGGMAAELAAEREELNGYLSRALAFPDQADEIFSSVPELSQFVGEDPRAVAMALQPLDEVLSQTKPAQPNFEMIGSGQFVDLNNPGAGARDIPGVRTPDPEVDMVDMGDVDNFRKEFSGLPAVKNFSLQTEGITRIVSAAQNPSPAGDLSLIFNFMKVLDPNSVVRESEFSTAEQASAWLQRSEGLGMTVPRPVASAIRRASTGERMSEEQRADFVNTAANIYRGSQEQYENIRQQYAATAAARGFPLDQALVDFAYSGDLPSAGTTPSAAGGALPTPTAPRTPAAPSFEFGSDDQRRVFEKYSGE